MRQGGWRRTGIAFAIAILVLASPAGPSDAGSARRPADEPRPSQLLPAARGGWIEDGDAEPSPGLIYLDPDLRPDRRYASPAQPQNPVLLMLEEGLEQYRNEWGGLPQEAIPRAGQADRADDGPMVDALFARLGVARSADGRINRALSERLRAFQRAHGLRDTGRPDAATIAALNRGRAHYEAIIRSNLEQARRIAVDPDAKLVFVNTAAARLTAYEGGQPVLEMNVAVGSADRPTPALADRIDTIVVNPRWNVPPHLVRASIAPAVVREGVDHLDEHDLVVLTDWSEDAKEADPHSVDWQAVALGAAFARVRQEPGAANPMGRMKFMFPNPLGIYLHDTPAPVSSSRSKRYVSNGCVRLERPGDLARFLAGHEVDVAEAGGSTRRIDLDRPVPVYIMPLTFSMRDGQPRFYPDVNG